MKTNPRKTKKKAVAKKKAMSSKRTYLREIEIRYRKRNVTSKSTAAKPIKGAIQVVKLFSDLQSETKEKLIAISLDTKLKIICFEIVAIGSVDAIYLKPFEAIRTAIAVNASGVIIVHNHPSGDPKPGGDDKLFTKALKKITEIGGMNFHDHIIIGDGTFFSFTDEGLLK